ncbi:MAG: dihydroorotate dehydrogenase-like protein [Saprospiraceae bacterium]
MDLRTTYMGLSLRSPIVVSASTLSLDVGKIVQMEDFGAGAVVLFSLFEEQIRAGSEHARPASREVRDYFPDETEYKVGVDQYLDIIRRAKERVNIPVIASLNGVTNEGWIDYARQVEQAGADGIEANIFFVPADLSLTGAEVEQRYVDIVKALRRTVGIPISVKLNPYFSAMGHMAKQLEGAGASGLALFNRFYQPNFDIDKMEVVFDLEYSHPNEIRLPLLWIAVLRGQLHATLAATTGVQGAKEVVKYLLAGADAVMTASALYKHGVRYLQTMHRELKEWMDRFMFVSVREMQGLLSQQNIADPSAYERANYIRILEGEK